MENRKRPASARIPPLCGGQGHFRFFKFIE